MTVVNAKSATFLGWLCVVFAVVAFSATLSIVLIKDRPELIGAAVATLAPLVPGIAVLAKVKKLRE